MQGMKHVSGSGCWKVCVLCLVRVIHPPTEKNTTLSQMLYAQKKQYRDTSDNPILGISIICTGRWQRRTAAIICIHIRVPNSLPEVGTGRSKAMSVCSLPVSYFHTLHLRISMTLSTPLCMSIYIANKALQLLKRNSYSIVSLAPYHRSFLLIFALTALLSLPPLLLPVIISSFGCFLQFAVPVSPFLSLPVALFLFPYIHLYSGR